MNTNRQWLLAKRPFGIVTRENFEYQEPGEQECLVDDHGFRWVEHKKNTGGQR